MKNQSITDNNHSDVPRVVTFLLLLIMSMHLSGPLWLKYFKATLTDGWSVGRVDHSSTQGVITKDDMIYIPRINAFANGDAFVDPWNNINLDWRGWGTFGIVPPALGGLLRNLTGGNHFFTLGVWGVINFFSMGVIIYVILRKGIFSFSRILSIFGVYLFLSYPWLGVIELWEPQNFIDSTIFGSVMCALTRIECGLFTYVFYVIFLWSYWKWVGTPTSKNSVVLGVTAALLGYVYTFHFMFAFLLIATKGLLYLYMQRWRDVRLVAFTCVIIAGLMIPFCVNSYYFNHAFAGNLFMERLDYSAGRIPSFEDYSYLKNLLLPICLGVVYSFAGQSSKNKNILLTELLVLVLAFVFLLHVRLVLGFMQAIDHLWRYSLALPATLWCIFVLADLGRLAMARVPYLRIFIRAVIVILPLLILIRGYLYTYAPERVSNDMKRWEVEMSEKQWQMVSLMNSLKGLVFPGEGFICTETIVNYHVMANFGARPFVANGLSPLSPESLTEKYLAATYLSGIDNINFMLTPINRKKMGFRIEKNPQLYLYTNLIQHNNLPQHRKDKIENMFQQEGVGKIMSTQRVRDYENVRLMIVDKRNLEKARKRLLDYFVIDKELTIEEWTVIRVHKRPLFLINN